LAVVLSEESRIHSAYNQPIGLLEHSDLEVDCGDITMIDRRIRDVAISYDRVADEYIRRIFDELEHKSLDRQLLDPFATWVAGRDTWRVTSMNAACRSSELTCHPRWCAALNG
jgi:hypothetical protein